VRKGDELTTFMCRVSRNSGALTYQKPQRPVVGLLYLTFYMIRRFEASAVHVVGLLEIIIAMVVILIGRIACMRRTRNAGWKKAKGKTTWEV